MFEHEKDERIRGIDEASTALAMAFAHDFILEIMLTREMLSVEPDEAARLSHILVERWQKRYGTVPLAEGAEPGKERVRRLDAAKAFVDRLARKALRRSTDARQAATSIQSGALPIEVNAEMKRAGAVALTAFVHLPPEELAAAVYRAMAAKATPSPNNGRG